MGEIVQFKTKERIEPEDRVIGHRISFYTEEELDITLIALNVYGFEEVRFTRKNLKDLDPLYIKKCLIQMRDSSLISTLGFRVINMIIANIEEVTENDYAHEV
jgi:hypothetical protein